MGLNLKLRVDSGFRRWRLLEEIWASWETSFVVPAAGAKTLPTWNVICYGQQRGVWDPTHGFQVFGAALSGTLDHNACMHIAEVPISVVRVPMKTSMTDNTVVQRCCNFYIV